MKKNRFYNLFLFLLVISLVFSSNTIAAPAPDSSITDPSLFMASMRIIWGLCIVIGVIFLIYTFAKKKFTFLAGNNEQSLIKIIEARHLMPKKSLYLVDVRGKEYLIGVSDTNINLVSKIDNFDDEDFKSILGQSVKGNRDDS